MRHPRLAFSLAATLAAGLAPRADAQPRADVPAETGSGAEADTRHDEVWLGGAARALRSPSANALTGADLDGVSLGVAREVGHDLGFDRGAGLLPGLALWAEAGLVTGTASGTMFQSLSTTIDELGLTAGLAARYRVHRRITVDARIALGAQRARVAISDGPGATAYDHGWGAMASASAALDVFIVAARRFGLGVRAEAGYVAAQGIALTLHSDRPDDALALAMTRLSIGHLDLGGPTAAVSVLAQF